MPSSRRAKKKTFDAKISALSPGFISENFLFLPPRLLAYKIRLHTCLRQAPIVLALKGGEGWRTAIARSRGRACIHDTTPWPETSPICPCLLSLSLAVTGWMLPPCSFPEKEKGLHYKLIVHFHSSTATKCNLSPPVWQPFCALDRNRLFLPLSNIPLTSVTL